MLALEGTQQPHDVQAHRGGLDDEEAADQRLLVLGDDA